MMDPENIKIKDLKLIVKIDRFQSLRALSRNLGLEPQNLSKKIAIIEESLSTKLFERSPKGISITSAGRRIIEQSKEVLHHFNQLQQMKEQNTPYKNYLSVCSRGFIISYLSPYLVKGVLGCEPETGLRFTDLSPEATEKVGRSNQINLVYSFGEIDLGKSWTQVKVGAMPFGLFVCAEHPLKDTVSWNQVKNYRFVGFSYIEKNQFLVADDTIINKNVTKRGFDSENAIYSKAIAINSLQIAQLPLVTVIDELNSGRIRPIKIINHKIKSRPVYMHAHIDFVSNKLFKQLKRFSTNAFNDLTEASNKYLS